MKGNRVFFLVFLVSLVGALLFVGVPVRAADKPMELRLAHMFPTNSPWHELMQAWAKKVAAESKGRLTIRIFPANNLVPAPELYDAVVAGTTDLAYGFRYMPKGQPIGVTFPFLLDAPDTPTAVKVYDDLWKKFPKALNEEWKEVKVLFVVPTLPQYLTMRKPVRRLDELKGLQIRVPSKEMGLFVKGLGAAPVFMSAADFVTGLEKGTIDGVTQAISSIPEYKLARTLKVILMHSLGVVTPRMLIINRDIYDRLPPDLQGILSSSGEWGKQEDIKRSVEAYDTSLKYCRSEGIEVVSLSKEDSEKCDAVAERTRDEIGAELDKKGYPGTEIVRFIRQQIKQYTR